MKKLLLFCFLQFFGLTFFAQTNQEKAFSIAEEAVQKMDAGEIEESILMLEESQKLDPESMIYPYEIAYAHILKQDFKTAAKIYQRLKKHKDVDSQVYQMLGNCYSYLRKPKKAIKTYEEGMKKFPKAGNLYLEKGNVFLHQKKYQKAIENYETGIKVDPYFPSNYYRLAMLFLNSNDKLAGLMYGEIFMNLERRTMRTREMSELLFKTYQSSIKFDAERTKVDFCKLRIDISMFENLEDFKIPFCALVEKHYLLASVEENKLDLQSLSRIRAKFLKSFLEENASEYPNVLFEFQKFMLDKNFFDAYNHYIFQIGNEAEFDRWQENNYQIFEYFIDWYANETSKMKITDENIFLRNN